MESPKVVSWARNKHYLCLLRRVPVTVNRQIGKHSLAASDYSQRRTFFCENWEGLSSWRGFLGQRESRILRLDWNSEPRWWWLALYLVNHKSFYQLLRLRL